MLESQASSGSPAHDGAKSHVGGARYVGRVKGQKGATVQHQAARDTVLQQATEGGAVDGGDLHDDHSRTA